ncbi:hypothetical protein D4R86_00870 [bacterium]|nr:MAG: hypothetical protein D4R86_00870 [bacterium]
MKKWIILGLLFIVIVVGSCKSDKDLRHPLINTNAFSSFIPLDFEAYTRTNRLENLDDKIEEIIRSDTNKPTNVFCPRN